MSLVRRAAILSAFACICSVSLDSAQAASEAEEKATARMLFQEMYRAEMTLHGAVKARDANAVNNDVSWPLIRLLDEWGKIGQREGGLPVYSVCFDATDNLRNVADLFLKEETADRRQARLWYLQKYVELYEQCKTVVGVEN